MNTEEHELRVLDALTVLTKVLASDYDVIDVLQALVDVCRIALDVDAAGVLLADPDSGELDLVASTDESARIVEAMQLGAVAGPCVDAYRESRVVSIADIGALTGRFSEFRDSALGEGFRSVHAVPLRVPASTIGALNLFRTEVGELDEAERRAAQVLADLATVGILHDRSLRASERLQRQLQYALDSRVVIEQAKGVLAHTHGLTMEEAFQRLRTFARSEHIGIADAARGLVERTVIF